MTTAVSLVFAGGLLGGSPAFATTFTVTTTADAGRGSLRDALAQARAGDTIAIGAQGTIALTSGPLYIRQNVTIAGPGPEILAISAGHAFRVFVVGDLGAVTAAISGVTIRDGNGDYGGGIVNGGTLTLTGVTLSANAAVFAGGAIYNMGSLSLHDSRISGNTSVYHGGGMFNVQHSTLTMDRTTVFGNESRVGGGLTNNNGTVAITASTFMNNRALQIGGGSGGAIYDGPFGSVRITASTIARNWTDGDGGAINTGLGSVTITASTVAENWSSCTPGGCVGGGGVFSNSSQVTIADSTLYRNVTLVYPWVGGNVISLYGTTTLRNSILAESGRNCLTYHPMEIVSDGHNLSDDDSCVSFLTGEGDLNGVTAGLSPNGLRDHGGPTETIALLVSSPAVDAVPAGACGTSTVDQRGVPRPQGGACDMGAFELTLIPATLDLAPPVPSSIVAGWIGPVALAATLGRTASATPVAGAVVTFLVDGLGAGTATTDAAGTASLPYDPSWLAPGNHAVQAVASRQTAGDDSYETAASGPQDLLVTPNPYAANIQQPIRADGSSVFNVNRGVVPVKFTVTYNGAPACELPPASVVVSRVAGTAAGPVNESDYVVAPDAGATFRVDSCQYVYNLGLASLGPGTYVASIAIGSTIVGRGTFGLR
jgi:hypothetical protein